MEVSSLDHAAMRAPLLWNDGLDQRLRCQPTNTMNVAVEAPPGGLRVGFGRIVVLEIEVPNMFAVPV
jgi:hypothetical protein